MTKHREINNSEDIIDSMDIIARIEELESEREDLLSEATDDPNIEINEAKENLKAWDGSEEATELKILKALAEEGESSPDWQCGETLIRESYFKEYAQQLADDIGAIDRNATWPVNCIDWEEAANQLKQDYMEIDFDGVTYLIRA
jgi:hypothetical protein